MALYQHMMVVRHPHERGKRLSHKGLLLIRCVFVCSVISRLFRFALLGAAGAVLAGCNLAPDYKRPESPVSTHWPNMPRVTYDQQASMSTLAQQPASAVSSESRSGAEIGWRDVFMDPRLQALIQIGLDNNRDLRIAVARVEQARAQYGVQRGELFPQIGAGIQGTRQRTPSDLAMFGPDGGVLSSQTQASIALTSFEIDLFGRLRNLTEAAWQNYLATEESLRTVHLSVVSEIANAYFRLRSADYLLVLVEQTLKSRKDSLDLVTRRFDAGVASQLDVNQAKTLLDSASADLASFSRQRAQAVNLLVLLIGQPLPDNLPEPAPFVRDQVLSSIPVGLPSDLLTRRPDIRGAENTLLAANANIGAARAAFFPTISLTGAFGTASQSLGGLFKAGSTAWTFTPAISIPIFTGGSLQSQLDFANAASQAAVAQYERTIQRAFREVADALAGEATYTSQIDAARAQQDAAGKTLELSNLRYAAGIDNYLQVQTAQVEYFTAQKLLVQARYNALANRVEFYKSLGGGWIEK